MVIGMPVLEGERPTFYWTPQRSFEYVDAAGNPFDWDAVPDSSITRAPVQANCAYEFSAPLGRQGAHETEVGQFNPTTLMITILDEEFEEIRGFRWVEVGPGQEKWYFRFYQPAIGLGDMTVYRITCTAEEPN